MPKVLSFINYKGGVGKTTSAYHVACALAQRHAQRVLMIDIDPQTNLTFLCVTPEDWQRRKVSQGTIRNLYDRYNTPGQALDVGRFTWKDAVVVGRYPIKGLDLIPCDIDLLGEDLGGGYIASAFSSMEAMRQGAQAYMKERSFLKKVIDDVKERYDWVIIDCPPNLYLMTQNALHASDYYVVTVIPDRLSTIGLNTLTSKIQAIGNMIATVQPLAGSNTDHAIASLGAIVFVKVRSGGQMITAAHTENMADIRGRFGDQIVVSQTTTELIGYSEAAEAMVPVWEHNSTNAGRARQQYPAITSELIAKLRRSP